MDVAKTLLTHKLEGNRTLTREEIKDRVAYHAPSPSGIMAHADLSMIIGNAILTVDARCPPGREKSLAITKLEEAKMWASASVARNPETR